MGDHQNGLLLMKNQKKDDKMGYPHDFGNLQMDI
jgi:hypothetical protein